MSRPEIDGHTTNIFNEAILLLNIQENFGAGFLKEKKERVCESVCMHLCLGWICIHSLQITFSGAGFELEVDVDVDGTLRTSVDSILREACGAGEDGALAR